MEIKPFRGFRYNPAVVGDPGRCIAPPYDVIDPDQQDQLYQQHANNIVRICKGKTTPQDSDGDNVYTRAAGYFQDFITQGVLKQDAAESIYVYTQEFKIGAASYRRSGFIALGKLESYGGSIRPHEQTLAGPKADRLNLTRAIKAQEGQIFMLYSEPEGRIDRILAQAVFEKELLHGIDDDGVSHKLYAIDNPADIAVMEQVMTGRDVFIADGHHRYETALNYYAETHLAAAAYQMMTFVNTHNEGLVVLPTHRFVKNLRDFHVPQFIGRLQEFCDVARLTFHDAVEKSQKREEMFQALRLEFDLGEHAFGIYFADDAFYVATVRDLSPMDKLAAAHCPAWRRLDVSILHKMILEHLLGIDEAALTAESHVEYIKDFGQATLKAIDRLDAGEGQALFFMNSTRIEEVQEVAAAGEKMPQKSTFFFPKIFSGLVINKLV